jgi:hypothetical protein
MVWSTAVELARMTVGLLGELLVVQLAVLKVFWLADSLVGMTGLSMVG